MAVYYVYSGAGGSNNGSSWANAFTTLTTAFATEVAGDTLFVAHDHAESTAAAITLTSSGTLSNPTKIICVDRAGTVPPVSADRRTTATVTTTGSSNISFAGTAHYDGMIFSAGNLTSTADIRLTGAVAWMCFDNCSLRCGGTNVSSGVDIGVSTGTVIDWNNTTVSFAAVGQSINIAGALRWRNTASALLNTIPTSLFVSASSGGEVECIGVDFSAAGSGKNIVSNTNTGASGGLKFRFIDCKLNAAVTKTLVPLAPGGAEVDFIRCGSGGTNYTVHRNRVSGALDEELTVVRTGGASDGVTPISWEVVTTATCTYSAPFICPPIAVWNDTDGSAVTATVEGIWGGGAVPNDDDIWLEVEYLGDNSSPQGSFVNDGKADLLASAAGQTSSSETWGGSTTKFKLAVTFTPNQPGWIYARVKVGKASTTAYIDPLVVLS